MLRGVKVQPRVSGNLVFTFLLLLGLRPLWMADRIKQKQREGLGDPTNTRKRARSSGREASFSSVYFKRTKNQPSILYKNTAVEPVTLRPAPFPRLAPCPTELPKNEDKTKKPKV